MFIILFAAYFLLLAAFSNKNNQSYLLIALVSVGWKFMDKLVYWVGASYESSVFIACCFSVILSILLCRASGRMSSIQSALLITAASIHTLQISDTINNNNYVYENYEVYILTIAIVQILVTYNDFITSCINALERVLTHLRMRHISNVCYNTIVNKVKAGEIKP